MNDFTWTSSACSIPDRLRSTSYARLQRCRSAHPIVAPALSPEDAARFTAQWNANFKHAIESGHYPGVLIPPIKRESPILRRAPQSAPERRDGPPWVLLAFCSAVFWGIAAYLLLR